MENELYSREVIGKTPHGGVKMATFFFDKNDNPCTEQESVYKLLYEYDEDDVVVFSIRFETSP